ncbi:hypothetical protein AVEN_26551-1 [Araneus ventricosus]|uniref:Uncharacterized protein n=1 Tax=Araneus ventricosus TaxID=182803 RepID=A0A4Y2QTV3_ARAVE|nr:hypothetical protein AVEN_26551-1 [Araneus ventricosus]
MKKFLKTIQSQRNASEKISAHPLIGSDSVCCNIKSAELHGKIHFEFKILFLKDGPQMVKISTFEELKNVITVTEASRLRYPRGLKRIQLWVRYSGSGSGTYHWAMLKPYELPPKEHKSSSSHKEEVGLESLFQNRLIVGTSSRSPRSL